MAKSKGVPRYYIDSCVFLSFIEGTADRIHAITALFDDCENGNGELFTSELSIAEVAFAKAEKDGRALDDDTEAKIDNLWDPKFPLHLVEVHQLIVQDSRVLIRQAMEAGWTHNEEWSLKPSDAIHLATAKRHHVNAFLTYDKRLRKFSTIMGYEIRYPSTPSQLFLADPEPPWKPRIPPHWRCNRANRPKRSIPSFSACLLRQRKRR